MRLEPTGGLAFEYRRAASLGSQCSCISSVDLYGHLAAPRHRRSPCLATGGFPGDALQATEAGECGGRGELLGLPRIGQEGRCGNGACAERHALGTVYNEGRSEVESHSVATLPAALPSIFELLRMAPDGM